MTGVPFNYLLSRSEQIRVISQLYRKAKSDGYVVPHVKGEGVLLPFSDTSTFAQDNYVQVAIRGPKVHHASRTTRASL